MEQQDAAQPKKTIPEPRKRIAVFGGSNTSQHIPAAFDKALREVTELFTAPNTRRVLVYNGSHRTFIGALATRILETPFRHVVGVRNLEADNNQDDEPHPGLTHLHTTETRAEQLQYISQLSDAFILFPGNFDDVKDFFDVLDLAQKEGQTKSFAILNINHHFDSLLEFIRQTTHHEITDLVYFSPEELFKKFEASWEANRDPLRKKIALGTIFQKGLINVGFRVTQIWIKLIDSYFLSLISQKAPCALPASALTSIMREPLVHGPGAFANILSIAFEEDNAKKTANLYFAARITLNGLNLISMPIMIWSGSIFTLFQVDPANAECAQAFFRAFVIGLPAIQGFSINRAFINSLCGDGTPAQNTKSVIVLIGLFEAASFTVLGYGFITGGIGFPFLGNAGSGYSYAITNWAADIISTGILLMHPTFSEYILQKPDPKLIWEYIKQLLKDGAPISLRVIMENLSLVGFSLIASSVSTDSLAALVICWTLLIPQMNPSFSFIHGAKALIKVSNDKLKTSFTILGITTGFSVLCVPILSAAARPLTSLFLTKYSAQDQQTILNINQVALPLLATAEVFNTVFHATRASLQNEKDFWFTTGDTFLFQGIFFLPLAYVIGKILDWGVPGMSGTYAVSMFLTALVSLLRHNFVLSEKRQVDKKPPSECWYAFLPCLNVSRNRSNQKAELIYADERRSADESSTRSTDDETQSLLGKSGKKI